MAQDLSELIGRAAEQAATQSRLKPLASVGRRRPVFSVLLAVMLAIAAVALVVEQWPHQRRPSPSKIADDLGRAVELARASIEIYRSHAGRLPEALPNASLASVVHYESKGSEYRLVASINGVEVLIDWNGTKSVNTSVLQ